MFIALFSISCNNAYEPFDDIPTISGSPVNDLNWNINTYGFTRAKLEVSPETAKNIAEAEVIFPAIYSKADGADLYIENGKISVNAPNSTIKNAQCYKSGNYYNARIDNGNVKSHVKLNMNDYPIPITVEYIVAMTTNDMSIRAAYTATLPLPPDF